MHITFVKKIKADGTECRKCIEVQSRLEKDGYIEKINTIVIADENDENSMGLKLAKEYEVEQAPFFIVEDDETTRDMLRKSLESNEFKVRSAVNGKEALDKIHSSKPGLILLDLMMPDISGLEVLKILKDDATRTYDNYEKMLNEKFDGTTIDENKSGLARELARMNLTLNTYTQWYWKTDLLNLLNFLSLRADSHAQYEIRAYADAMLDTVKKWVPITYEAFMDYRVGGLSLIHI